MLGSASALFHEGSNGLLQRLGDDDPGQWLEVLWPERWWFSTRFPLISTQIWPLKGTGNIRKAFKSIASFAKELQIASYGQQGTAEVGKGGDELRTSTTGLRFTVIQWIQSDSAESLKKSIRSFFSGYQSQAASINSVGRVQVLPKAKPSAVTAELYCRAINERPEGIRNR